LLLAAFAGAIVLKAPGSARSWSEWGHRVAVFSFLTNLRSRRRTSADLAEARRLRANGSQEEAVALYEEVIARSSVSSDPREFEKIAFAMMGKGYVLSQLGRSEASLDAYNSLIRRFGDSGDSRLRLRVAQSLIGQGSILTDLGRFDEARSIYEELITRFGSAPERHLGAQVAWALYGKGFDLEKMGRHEDAIEAFDELDARFGNSPESGLREPVSAALATKGWSLGQLGTPVEEIAVLDRAERRLESTARWSPRRDEDLARAFVLRGDALGKLGRHNEAIAQFEKVVDDFGETVDATLVELVASALTRKAAAESQAGRPAQALSTSEQAIQWLEERIATAPEPPLAGMLADAYLRMGITLGDLDRRDEAIACFDRLVALYGDAPEARNRNAVVSALIRKGSLLSDLDLPDEATRAYADALSLYDRAPVPNLEAEIAFAMLNHANLLAEAGHELEAVVELESLAARFSGNSDPDVLDQLDAAADLKSRLAEA
jgi:tetratricopeptide (TPR) repeat protein